MMDDFPEESMPTEGADKMNEVESMVEEDAIDVDKQGGSQLSIEVEEEKMSQEEF